MKKKSIITLVVFMLLFTLSACGANVNNSENSNGNGSGNTNSENSESVEVDISVLEGKYWFAKAGEYYIGVYMDGNGNFINVNKSSAYTAIDEYTIEKIETEASGEDTEISFHLLLNGESIGALRYVLCENGTFYCDSIDNGSEYPLNPVSEDVFYCRVDYTDESEKPNDSEKPEDSEQGASEDSQKPEQNKPDYKFEGVYWIMNNGWDPSGDYRAGFYLDGKGTITKFRDDEDGYKLEKYEYKNLKKEKVEEGMQYTFDVVYPPNEWVSESMDIPYRWVVSDDGNIYYEWHDVDCGGIDVYKPTTKEEFYTE